MSGEIALGAFTLTLDLVTLGLLSLAGLARLSGLRKLTFMDLAFAGMALQAIGSMSLGAAAGQVWSARLFAACLLMFSIATVIGQRRFVGKVREYRDPVRRPAIGAVELALALMLLLVVTIWHFSLAGIPLFSPNVETARFDSGASGAFGIPFRMAVYGLPMFAIYCTAVARTEQMRGGSQSVRIIATVSWLCAAIAALLQGTRGGVLWIILVWIIAQSVLAPSRGYGISKTVIAGLGIGVGLALASLLATLTYGGSSTGGSFLATRLTETAARPYHYIVNTYSNHHPPSPGAVWNDVAYVWGLLPGTSSVSATTLKIVSGEMWGLSPNDAPPITPSIVGYLFLVGGAQAAVIGMAIWGYIGGLASRARPLRFGVSRSALLAIVGWYIVVTSVRGNPIYLGANFLFTGLLLFGLLATVRYLLVDMALHASKRMEQTT